MRAVFTCLFASFSVCCAFAQTDSLQALSEVVVTATRTEKALSAVPLPVLVIDNAQIKAMGSLRLNEVLQEQTGLAIVTEHGQGIQLQGFNPDYTLILIDGEPLVGRTAGTLELSRLAVGNIKQIEIIKGASSSLYGSEALAGVINIITENPNQTKATVSSRYGSNQTLDVGANLAYKKEKWGANIFVNRYSTGGYDFTPETYGQTVEPFHSYTLQTKWHYKPSHKLKLKLSARYFTENQQARFEVGTIPTLQQVAGAGKVQDFNLNPTLDYVISSKWKIQARFYQSRYATESRLAYQSDHALFDESYFKQTFTRPEVQADYSWNEKNALTIGAGNIWESVEATRYTEKKRFTNTYLYGQYEFEYKKWHLITGARFDAHAVYGSQLSPKISLQYKPISQLSLRGSVGKGFKAPDFRQLYLNFTNAVAGYTVFGSEELPQMLQALQAQNQLADILLSPDQIGKLEAEKSTNINIGLQATPAKNLTYNLNAFRNDVHNLIESQTVARRTNGQSIFSYRNLHRIFTQGIETDLNYKWKNWSFSTGYQYLIAKDKTVVENIKKGDIFRRDAQTLVTTRVQSDEYGGLMGRSRNMLNIKVFYQNEKKGISANMRAVYRGRFGFGDMNNNAILDANNEYVAGFWTLHASVGKDFIQQHLRLQIGAENLLNYREATFQPNIAGRLLWASLQLNFQKNQN
jgi:outer membrane receptor for ferrienterochelin and colicins